MAYRITELTSEILCVVMRLTKTRHKDVTVTSAAGRLLLAFVNNFAGEAYGRQI